MKKTKTISNKNPTKRHQGKIAFIVSDKLKFQICVFLSAGTLAILLFCVLLYMSIGRVAVYVPSESSGDSQNVIVYIDSVSILESENRITIEGWALFHGQTIRTNNTSLLLRNMVNGQYLKLPTVMTSRPDVTRAFYDETSPENFNYDRSGWRSNFLLSALDFPLQDYEIAVLYKNDGHYIVVHTRRRLGM